MMKKWMMRGKMAVFSALLIQELKDNSASPRLSGLFSQALVDVQGYVDDAPCGRFRCS